MKGRDKRRRVKERKQNHNPAGVTVLPKVTESANGKYCIARSARIDASVCTVISTREPQACVGCAG